jgi:peptidoglycan/LPS O-acetylase OafA/YrhL
MDSPAPFSRRNLVALDGLRGLAILGVMCCHLESPGPGGGLLQRTVRLVLHQGWAGVDLFFVLSGFLITGILLDTRDSTNYFSSFYCRRALRIFPLYYAFLLLAWLFFPSTVQAEWMPVRADWWLYPTYLMNWLVLWKDVWHANVLGHFWSLCVEEQFYAVWPLIVLALRPRRLLGAVACAEITMLVGRAWWIFHYGTGPYLSTATITRMDGLLFGAACAVAVRQFRFSGRMVGLMPWVAGASVAVFLALAKFWDHQQDTLIPCGEFTLLAIGFSAILLYAVLTDSKRTRLQFALRWPPLTRVGKYAYGIYVFHVPLFYFISRRVLGLPEATRDSWMVSSAIVALKFSVTFAIASLSYNLFEKRFLALKHRFEPEYQHEREIRAAWKTAGS